MAEIEILGDTARVPLHGRGDIMWATVDAEDLPLIAHIRWGRSQKGSHPYALVRQFDETGKRLSFYMHRMVVDAPFGSHVDHINGDTLDNRKSNLRLCTHAQNMRNRAMVSTNKSGFKGVWKHGRGYYATIHSRGKKARIGPFSSPELAAAAYAGAATVLFGEFARFDLP